MHDNGFLRCHDRPTPTTCQYLVTYETRMKTSLLVILFLSLAAFSPAQTTYNFNTAATISGGTGGFGIWNTQADITIGGVAYRITSGGNGSLTNQTSGGSGNSKCLRKDGSGGDQFTLSRADGQPFQFYGMWVKHQSMNGYAEFMSLPPFFSVTYSTPDEEDTDPTYIDNTPMQGGQYTTSSTTLTTNVTVTSVQITFNAIIYYWIDDISVGPVSSAAPSFSSHPSDASVCAGSNTSFSVSASNASTYQWQVNTGAAFSDISNGGVYSGATTATLSITGATSGMTGYSYRCVATGSSSVNSNSATLTVKSISVSSTTQTNVPCYGGNNGTASVSTPTGGTAPYTYNWTPGNPTGDGTTSVSGLTAGAWSVTITDNAGCTLVKNFTITQPAAITATTSKTDVTCNGGTNGSASVSASGGTGPYTYAWSPSGGTRAVASGLAAGTYSCTITDANACYITKNFTITQPPAAPLSFSAQPQDKTAATNGNASFTVTAVNATNYQWQVNTGTGFSNLSNIGVYSGATTASLSITEATRAMNGYLYRCVISASCGSPVTSNSAQLTVKSNDASLSALTLNDGELSPGFSSGTFRYSVEVPAGRASITISPVANDSKANFTVNGNLPTSGSASLNLEGGNNSITILVTAEDGETTREYTLTVYRPFVSVSSITRANAQYLNQSECTFIVKFGGAVNNVSAENFDVTASSTISGYSIEGVSQTAPDTYNVTVNTGEGNGTLGLSIVNSGGLSAPVSGLPYEEGEQYIIDKSSPDAKAKIVAITLGADGSTSVSAQDVNDGSTDNQTDNNALEYSLAKTSFTAEDLGENMVSFSVTDQAGNSTTIYATIVVRRNINSVGDLEPIVITYGDHLSLPSTVEVTYSDLVKENLEVTWDTNAFSGHAGEYALTGSIAAGANTTNSEDLAAHIAVQVNKRPVYVKLKGVVQKTYDGTVNAILAQENFSSDKLQGDDLMFEATATYDNKNAGEGKSVRATNIELSGEAAADYQLENESANAGIGSITARALNVTVGGPIEKTYDGAKTATLTATNFLTDALEGDDIHLSAYAEYDNRNAGEEKTVTASDFFVSGEDAGNYSLATEIAQTTGSILRREIIVTANAAPAITKVYDASVDASTSDGNYSLHNIVSGDDVKVTGRAIYDNRNVGAEKSVTIDQLVLSGAAKDNYTLTTERLETTGEITAKPLTAHFIESAHVSKVYDGTTSASIPENALYVDGVIGEDLVGVVNPGIGEFDNKHAGAGKQITVDGLELSGEDAANYVLESRSVSGAVGEIVPKDVTVVAANKSKVYGAGDPQLTYTADGVLDGEQLLGALGRESGRNVGTYAIGWGTLSGGRDYEIVDFTPATLTITPAPLTIRAEDKTRLQGVANPALTISYSGFVSGDSPADLASKPVASTDATDRSPIGYYAIGVSGAASQNYAISYVAGRLTVRPPGDAAGSVKAWSSGPGTIEVRVYAEAEQDATITLFTELGQPIVIHKRHLNAGINLFNLPSRKLASSTYVLSVFATKFQQGERVQVK